MDKAEALTLLSSKPSGHLATVTPDRKPHVVVVTFALVGDTVVTAVDHKPKSTRRLRRLSNIENNPWASFLVDEYSSDWSALWWVRIDGTASIHTQGAVFEAAIDSLVDRYPQYQARRPAGPVIAVEMDDVSWWTSTR